MTPREVVVLIDRADVLKALRDALNVTDNRVTQAFGKPWLDDAASRIMAIQPAAHPAATAREEAWKAMRLALERILSNALGVSSDKRESLVSDDVLQEGRRALALARSTGGDVNA